MAWAMSSGYAHSVKQKHRYRRKRKGDGLIQEWPTDCPKPDKLSERVRYVGSAEHKSHPLDESFDFDPDLRSDASRCAPQLTRDHAQTALSEAVRRLCVSEDFEGDFPRYAWAWIDETPYVARLTNKVQGAYKGWPIETLELPADRSGRLARQAWEGDGSV